MTDQDKTPALAEGRASTSEPIDFDLAEYSLRVYEATHAPSAPQVTTTFRPFVYLHSDAVIPGCDCGGREWEVQLPETWHWVSMAGPGTFETLQEAHTYAATLHPGHPDVRAHITQGAPC